MQLVRSAVKIIFGFLITTVLLIVLALFWMVDPLEISSPSDASLLALFHSHRTEFVNLRDMALEDSLSNLFFSLTTLKSSKLGEARQKQWQQFLKGINPKLIVSSDRGMVNFMFAEGEILAIGPGWSKGITYIPNHQERYGVMVSDLAEASKKPANTYLRSIEPGWFCYYQRYQ